jgi:hypothetical protein
MDPVTFATPVPLSLEVRIPAGTIDVTASETTESRVHLTGERDPKDVRIDLSTVRGGGQRLLVEYRPKKAFGWFGGSDDLRCTIDVPIGTEVKSESGSADLTVAGRVGALAYSSGSGDLTFDDVDGTVNVKVASGDVRGEAVGGELTVHSASGDVRVASVAGTATVRTASGDAELGRADDSVRAMSASGDVLVDAVCRGQVNVRTVSGDVSLGVVPGTQVWLDLISTSGDAISELEGSDGGEGASVEIRAVSVSGDIHVRRAPAAVS